MKIQVDGQEIFKLEEWEKKAIQHDIPSEIFDADMKRRLEWVLKHKVERCFERLQREWLPKLRNDSSIKSIPVSPEEFINLITSRPDYKNRSQRDAEAIKDKK